MAKILHTFRNNSCYDLMQYIQYNFKGLSSRQPASRAKEKLSCACFIGTQIWMSEDIFQHFAQWATLIGMIGQTLNQVLISSFVWTFGCSHAWCFCGCSRFLSLQRICMYEHIVISKYSCLWPSSRHWHETWSWSRGAALKLVRMSQMQRINITMMIDKISLK